MQSFRHRPFVAATGAMAIAICLAIAPAPSLAQGAILTQVAATDPAKDPFRAKLLPPDIVMRLGHKAGVTTGYAETRIAPPNPGAMSVGHRTY